MNKKAEIPVETTSIQQKLLEVQRECAGTVGFDKSNPHFKNKYASLEQVLNKLLPALNRVGLVLMQKVALIDGLWCVRTVVMDGTALEELSCMPIISSKPDAQGFGSALSYAKRYSLLSSFTLVGGDEPDDDGEAACGTNHKPIELPKPKAQKWVYDGSAESKGKLLELFKKYKVSDSQMKEIAPMLIGKSYEQCETHIDGVMASIKAVEGVFES